jgi:uncharacterized protein GlcG (DUF336 family)
MYKVESLGLEEAKVAVEAILEEALREPGPPVAIAVVDNRGELICYARMNGATPFNRLMAIRKAFTAAQMGIDTLVLREGLKAVKMNFADFGSTDITLVQGGVCVNKPDSRAVLGGIGVSGRLEQQDEELARAGLKALKL